jgi:Putative zinc-finger
MMQHLNDQQIADYRVRRLAPAEVLQIDHHLSYCAECSERVAAAADLSAALRKAPHAEHLTYEELEAYVDGTASGSQVQTVREHIKTCRGCLDELRDLEAFKDELGGKPIASREQEGSWLQKRKAASWFPPSRMSWALAAAALVILAVALERRFMSSPVAPTHGSGGLSSLEQTIAVLPKEDQGAVLDAISQQRFSTPDVLKELRSPEQTLLGESAAPRFGVIAPVGEVVMDTRPTFRWQGLAGATGYSVAIFDTNLNPVQSSPRLQTTEWTPREMLQRGQVYQWQVTATLPGGKSVNSPSPPSPEAKFQVLGQQKADEIERLRAAHRESHLVLGILYMQAGMLEASEGELGRILVSDPDYGLAQQLLKSIQDVRRTQLK